MDANAAAPMRAARHRLHAAALDLDIRVSVAVPLPIGRGADRLHHKLAKHLGQGPPPNSQQGKAQPVDAHVVVLPERAGRLQVAMRSFFARTRTAADAAVAVDQVGLAPQLTFPFGGLLQQVVPSDRSVARRLETAIVDLAPHRLMNVPDQAAIEGEAGEDREVALRGAEGQVIARGIAPFGDDLAVTQHEAVRTAARPDRPQRLVPRRLLLEIVRDGMREVAAPWRLVFGGVLRRRRKRGRVKPGGFRRGALPLGRMRGRNIGHGWLFQWFRLDFRAIGTTSGISAPQTASLATNEPRKAVRNLLNKVVFQLPGSSHGFDEFDALAD